MSNDRGSASIVVLGVALAIVVVSVPVVLVAGLLASHRYAVRAADLAALAGAQHSVVDESVACPWAQRVAVENGARLRECRLERGSLLVVVERPASVDLVPDVRATARAGPS